MILNASWQDQLLRTLNRFPYIKRSPRLAILGIGNELCGDDSAGVLIAEALQQLIENQDVLVINAGTVPENFVGVLRRFMPGLVLMVDSARMGKSPGEVEWIKWENVTGVSVSTHTLPLNITASYLVDELDCEVTLIGIQPDRITIGAPLSQEVQNAIDEIISIIVNSLQGTNQNSDISTRDTPSLLVEIDGLDKGFLP
jgi:hydrogenase 3 maturation protease